MAKFTIEYNIFLGDVVRFKKSDGSYQQGVVQDISQLPDVFVEGFEDGEYNRWRRGIDSLELVYSENDESGQKSWTEIGSKEAIEFVHGDNFEDKFITYYK